VWAAAGLVKSVVITADAPNGLRRQCAGFHQPANRVQRYRQPFSGGGQGQQRGAHTLALIVRTRSVWAATCVARLANQALYGFKFQHLLGYPSRCNCAVFRVDLQPQEPAP